MEWKFEKNLNIFLENAFHVVNHLQNSVRGLAIGTEEQITFEHNFQ